MEAAIVKQNTHWQKKKYTNLIDREQVFNVLERLYLKEIQVLSGVRRSGKSSIIKLVINKLAETEDAKSILFLNFDDPFFISISQDPTNLFLLVETAEKITGTKVKYLFLDEIQNIYMWEKYVKTAYDNEFFEKIIITGSNTNLMSGEYATLLSGRYISHNIYPFSIKEIMKFKGYNNLLDVINNKSDVLNIIDDMMQYGSFPQVFKTNIKHKREVLISYYETILVKDCVLNNNIRDVKLLKYLTHYLISNNAKVYSYRSIAKAVGSNENTIRDYIEILKNSYIIDEINNFSYSLKIGARQKNKNYCVDNGLIEAISFKFSENKGRLLENLVFTEYRKAGYKEIYFYNQNKECDFIFKKDNKLIAVQVSYELNEHNREREINALWEVNRKFGITDLKLITYNTTEEIEGISIEPIWKAIFN